MIDRLAWLSDAFASAGWLDALDVAVLSLLIYRVLVVMQGTRALQSLLGLGLVVVMYAVAWSTGLTALHWVLDKLFVYVVIALLILFQEDIRRALARAGGTLFGAHRAVRAPSEANVMEELIKTCFTLAHRRIGALIVLERSASLGPYVEGGHTLDAVVTTELLQSIFHPSSPLHDGAVVVSDGRAVAAGVFLPISLSKQLSRSFGTRHRAAVGITEETDGVCLVVSEERGTVALVSRGEVNPVADVNELRQLLVERLEAPDPNVEAREPASGGSAA